MDELLGGVRHRTRTHVSKKSKKSRSKSQRSKRSNSKGKKVKRTRSKSRKSSKPKKTYTRVSKNGKDLGGEYRGASPSDAAKKAAKVNLKETGTDTAEVCLRQVTTGRGHNKIICYKAKQTMIPPTEHMIEVWGRDPNKKVRSVTVTRVK